MNGLIFDIHDLWVWWVDSITVVRLRTTSSSSVAVRWNSKYMSNCFSEQMLFFNLKRYLTACFNLVRILQVLFNIGKRLDFEEHFIPRSDHESFSQKLPVQFSVRDACLPLAYIDHHNKTVGEEFFPQMRNVPFPAQFSRQRSVSFFF